LLLLRTHFLESPKNATVAFDTDSSNFSTFLELWLRYPPIDSFR
jgi:hypothetical protein